MSCALFLFKTVKWILHSSVNWHRTNTRQEVPLLLTFLKLDFTFLLWNHNCLFYCGTDESKSWLLYTLWLLWFSCSVQQNIIMPKNVTSFNLLIYDLWVWETSWQAKARLCWQRSSFPSWCSWRACTINKTPLQLFLL